MATMPNSWSANPAGALAKPLKGAWLSPLVAALPCDLRNYRGRNHRDRNCRDSAIYPNPCIL